MPTNDVLTLEASLDQTRGEGTRGLLVGNGFSIACDSRFRYDALKDNAAMPQLSIDKEALFGAAGSNDFETVIRYLDQAVECAHLYGCIDDLFMQTIPDDVDVVKTGLVEALLAVHPAGPHEIDAVKFQTVDAFLDNFSRIFSVSYDLLLYWASMPDKRKCRQPRRDGFAYHRDGGARAWGRGIQEVQLSYIHGAMHLFEDGNDCCKLTFGSTPLTEQLRQNLAAGKTPLVITEGTRAQKESRIADNAYLRWCFEGLRSFRGPLFTFGLAFSENDDHILEAILDGAGRASGVYIGLYSAGSAESERTRGHVLEVAERLKSGAGPAPSPDIHFFETRSAKVW